MILGLSLSLARHACPEEGQQMEKELIANEASPEARPFLASTVGQSQTLQVVLEKKYVLMTEPDFVRFFGQKHKSKHPRIPKVWIPGADNKPELHYCFKPSDLSHKTLKLVSAVMETKSEEVLKSDNHMFLSQAQDLLAFQHKQRMESTGCSTLLSPQSWSCLSTVEEYKEHIQ